jgi:hypothetical protein
MLMRNKQPTLLDCNNNIMPAEGESREEHINRIKEVLKEVHSIDYDEEKKKGNNHGRLNNFSAEVSQEVVTIAE